MTSLLVLCAERVAETKGSRIVLHLLLSAHDNGADETAKGLSLEGQWILRMTRCRRSAGKGRG